MVEKLRLANDKLRYRIHILEAATAEELSQAKGAEEFIQRIKTTNIHDLSLGCGDTQYNHDQHKQKSEQ